MSSEGWECSIRTLHLLAVILIYLIDRPALEDQFWVYRRLQVSRIGELSLEFLPVYYCLWLLSPSIQISLIVQWTAVNDNIPPPLATSTPWLVLVRVIPFPPTIDI